MSEAKQLAIVLTSVIAIGIIGLALAQYIPSLLAGDVVVKEYNATLYLNGTLIEDYVYEIKEPGKYRMLYRIWDAPVSLSDLNQPYIEVLDVKAPEGSIGYVKDYEGRVWAPSNIEDIRNLAELNEVGCFNPNKFDSGIYEVEYVFRVHPPVECDEELCHVNLKLADEHLPYLSVSLTLEDGGLIEEVYPHPPNLKISRDGWTEISGSSWSDELLEIELLLKPDVLKTLDGFIKEVDDVKSITIQANVLYQIQYLLAEGLMNFVRILVIAFPFILVFLYIRHGREKSFIVPAYLSYVPNRDRKPWIVNLVFKSDALDFDENGFYATILDLHRREKIRIEPRDERLIIRILNEDPEDLDIYEKRVLKVLKSLSQENVLDTGRLDDIIDEIKSDRKRAIKLARDIRWVTRTPSRRPALSLIVSGRRRIVPFALLAATLFFISLVFMQMLPYFSSITTQIFVGSLIFLIQSLVAVAAPSTLFGRWRGSTYKEKLEWDAFKKFLSDLALIKRYAPQDISIWGEWLIYGTALGVGDKVVKAMNELNISLREASIAVRMPRAFTPIMVITSTRSGGGGGGGFGAGGGFGGGGAGAR